MTKEREAIIDISNYILGCFPMATPYKEMALRYINALDEKTVQLIFKYIKYKVT